MVIALAVVRVITLVIARRKNAFIGFGIEPGDYAVFPGMANSYAPWTLAVLADYTKIAAGIDHSVRDALRSQIFHRKINGISLGKSTQAQLNTGVAAD